MGKILISAYGCEPDKGSEPGAGWNWALQLAARHEVIVMTRNNNKMPIETELKKRPQPQMGFIYYDLPSWLCFWKKGQKGIWLYYVLWQIGAYMRARKIVQREKISLVFAVTFGTMWLPTFMYLLPVPFIWGPVGGGEGVPEVLWPRLAVKQRMIEKIRRMNRYISVTNPWFRPACRKASALIIRTEDSLACIPEKYRSKCRLMLETGIDAGKCRNYEGKTGKDNRTFVVSGRLIGSKFADIAIAAMNSVVRRHPEARLKIVGDGECRKSLEDAVIKYGLQDQVLFDGMVSKEQSIAMIQEALALVVTSAKEGGSWVLYEAMLCKTPIICMDTSGMHILVEKQGGIKILPADYDTMVKQFAAAMIWMLENPLKAKEMGEVGNKAVYEKWTWDEKGNFFEELLQEYELKI